MRKLWESYWEKKDYVNNTAKDMSCEERERKKDIWKIVAVKGKNHLIEKC